MALPWVALLALPAVATGLQEVAASGRDSELGSSPEWAMPSSEGNLPVWQSPWSDGEDAYKAYAAAPREERIKQREALKMKFSKDKDRLQNKMEGQALTKQADAEKSRYVAKRGHRRELQGIFGDIAKADFEAFLRDALGAVQREEAFALEFGAATGAFKGKVSQFSQSGKRKVENFGHASRTEQGPAFLQLVGRLFDEALFSLGRQKVEAQALIARLSAGTPGTLNWTIQPIVSFLDLGDLTLRFNSSDAMADACSKVSDVMLNISQYERSLVNLQERLNSSAKVVPMIGDYLPKTGEEKVAGLKYRLAVTELVHTILTLSFLQVDAVQEHLHDLVHKAGPAIANKLQCDWQSGGARAPALHVSLAAVALALAAWHAW